MPPAQQATSAGIHDGQWPVKHPACRLGGPFEWPSDCQTGYFWGYFFFFFGGGGRRYAEFGQKLGKKVLGLAKKNKKKLAGKNRQD